MENFDTTQVGEIEQNDERDSEKELTYAEQVERKMEMALVRKNLESLADNILKLTTIVRERHHNHLPNLDNVDAIARLLGINNEIHELIRKDRLKFDDIETTSLLFINLATTLESLYDPHAPRSQDDPESLAKISFSLNEIIDSGDRVMSSMVNWDLSKEDFAPIAVGISKVKNIAEELSIFAQRKRSALEDYNRDRY